MSLQRKLLWLLLAFVAFCLSLTFGTIYGVRLHVAQAMLDLQQSQSDTTWLEQVRLTARQHGLELREVVIGLRNPDTLDDTRRDDFLAQLHQVARYALEHTNGDDAEATLAVGTDLRSAFNACLEAIQKHDQPAALVSLTNIERNLLPRLNRCLQRTLISINASRSNAVDTVVVANTQILILALLFAVLGIGFILVGTYLIRRWILLPVRRIEDATRALGSGELHHRITPVGNDELGHLAAALNDMADRLNTAQADLSASEAKYRALFTNLRDATLICDAQGRIIECQDGETALLGRLAQECVGSSLLDVCPAGGEVDWSSVLGRILTRNQRVSITDLRLNRQHDPANTAIIDATAFPVQWSGTTYVALVLRDVTEERRSQEQIARIDAMEATVTLARGVAHDFSGLLTAAIGSLSVANSELTSGRPSELVRRALRACGQAVGLSRTLLTFAGGDRGNPEELNLRETVELITQSLDDEQLNNIELQLHLQDVNAYIDRDQFTEIVLNLVKNACEAMPEGGTLDVRLHPAKLLTSQNADGPPTHALLTVTDTGDGISDDVRKRLFEPFFTTKTHGRETRRQRGMGLSVVYAAVKNAGGTIDVQGRPGHGATFRLWLPFPQ